MRCKDLRVSFTLSSFFHSPVAGLGNNQLAEDQVARRKRKQSNGRYNLPPAPADHPNAQQIRRDPLKDDCRDFPGSPVVKKLPSNAGGVGSNPDWETKTPHAAGVTMTRHSQTN